MGTDCRKVATRVPLASMSIALTAVVPMSTPNKQVRSVTLAASGVGHRRQDDQRKLSGGGYLVATELGPLFGQRRVQGVPFRAVSQDGRLRGDRLVTDLDDNL